MDLHRGFSDKKLLQFRTLQMLLNHTRRRVSTEPSSHALLITLHDSCASPFTWNLFSVTSNWLCPYSPLLPPLIHRHIKTAFISVYPAAAVGRPTNVVILSKTPAPLFHWILLCICLLSRAIAHSISHRNPSRRAAYPSQAHSPHLPSSSVEEKVSE